MVAEISMKGKGLRWNAPNRIVENQRKVVSIEKEKHIDMIRGGTGVEGWKSTLNQECPRRNTNASPMKSKSRFDSQVCTMNNIFMEGPAGGGMNSTPNQD